MKDNYGQSVEARESLVEEIFRSSVEANIGHSSSHYDSHVCTICIRCVMREEAPGLAHDRSVPPTNHERFRPHRRTTKSLSVFISSGRRALPLSQW